ncbi:hypothetical protein RAC89_11130 [Paenibacillus sp. GD4]|uniref:hypothetical protein n=1 Tax=Paenibacillus sp. GD4 TaxID=3068890 RepID=UPI002796CE0D|nr:hypothetical protein [Paenibacillus sp. GD4]MDQ1911004.1 hypothetical protein [Paenibacillus sp. GD4]
MWKRIRDGGAMALRQPFAVFALFIYNLVWGLALYKWIQSIAVPLLHRYPGGELSREAIHLFWVEGQFQIMKTDLLEPYLWWGAGLLALRMVLSPLMNAAVYYSLRHTNLNAGYRFVEGIRTLSLPYFGLYVLQVALTLTPLVWLVPQVESVFGHARSYTDLGLELLPSVGGYALYVFLLQLLFLFLQIGRADGKSTMYTLLFFFRHIGMIVLLGGALLLMTMLLSAAVMTASFLWAGFVALIGFQIYRLLHMFCKMWAITTQYSLWQEKA